MADLNKFLGVVMVLVAVFMLLGIGTELTQRAAKKADSRTITNESHTFVNDTCKKLNQCPIIGITQVVNTTGILPSARYETGPCVGEEECAMKVVTNTDNSTLDWKVTYNTVTQEAFRAGHNATMALSELAQWSVTIGLVLSAMLIVGLVATAFFRMRR